MLHGMLTRRGRFAGAMAMLTAWSVVPAAVVRAAPADPTAPGCATRVGAADRASLWAPPLDRIVSVRLTDAPVREALDQIAGLAKLELSYSSDLLPSGRRVCLALTKVPVGAVLESLLSGSTLRPIVLGTAQVVLAPSRPAAVAADAPAVTTRHASVLDRVVVTGSPDGASQRGSPFALDVVDGATLAQHGVSTLGEAMDLAVPGVWTWTASAGMVTARYGSIRGASSFGASAPKIYLDGIEVANPLLVTQLDPSRVARVEVIRGPQGAALYGADAISGVVNILTRHDGTSTGGTQVQLSTSAGLSATAFAPRDAFVQDHAISLRRGSASRSLGLGFNVGTVGAYVPGASERRLLADMDGRLVKGRAVLTGTARFSLQRANASTSAMFDVTTGALSVQPTYTTAARRSAGPSVLDSTRGAPLPRDTARFLGDSATGQDLQQYTVGGSAAFMPNLHWTHTAIVGIDGYRLRGLSTLATAAPLQYTALASVSNAQGAADRTTLRLRSVGRFDVAPATLLTLTLGAEQSMTREASTATVMGWSGAAPAGGTGGVMPRVGTVQQSTTWYDNAGVSAQGQVAWRDRWFASAGVRAERTTGATPNAQQSLLPMLGAAYVRDLGGSVLKFRGAFGKGIRPARTLLRTSSWIGRSQAEALEALEAEQQQGTEFGADLLLGARTSLHLTRFDQRASGLIQPVGSMTTTTNGAGRLQRTMSYTLQNVGAIDNRGWELEGVTRLRALTLSGTWSYVDSRVAKTAAGYRGELRPGDRMLDVPLNTLSFSAAYTRGRLTVTSTATHAANWVGYDRNAIGAALVADSLPRDLDGPLMRRYWTTYGGVTRWRGSTAFRLRGDLSMVLTGDNLLNVQRGAPDNASVIAGRTLSLGFRTLF
ncbi:MAG: TonB-dependent receptor [Gemmatimonadaceae bacterium]|nr:TonB-dependent receptor [Gemmatimonadaceae bacterium]